MVISNNFFEFTFQTIDETDPENSLKDLITALAEMYGIDFTSSNMLFTENESEDIQECIIMYNYLSQKRYSQCSKYLVNTKSFSRFIKTKSEKVLHMCRLYYQWKKSTNHQSDMLWGR